MTVDVKCFYYYNPIQVRYKAFVYYKWNFDPKKNNVHQNQFYKSYKNFTGYYDLSLFEHLNAVTISSDFVIENFLKPLLNLKVFEFIFIK